jgi:hypothetical protein
MTTSLWYSPRSNGRFCPDHRWSLLNLALRDYRNESLEQITRRMFRAKGFPGTKEAESFMRECRKAFDIRGQNFHR